MGCRLPTCHQRPAHMRRIGVFGFELSHPRLRFFTSSHGLDARDETAFLDDEFVVDGGGEGKRHDEIVGQAV